MTPRERIVRLILFILANPYTYTRKEIAARLDITRRNVDDDIEIIRALLKFEQNKQNWTCAIVPDREFKELKYLLPLTGEDRLKITNALRVCSSKDQMYLNKKLDSLYDFQQLGIRALRRPVIEKIDRLKAAQNTKVCVILENYYSNTSTPRNRKVEPFLIDADLDTLQAFDVEKKATRHFRLNRIERVQLTEEEWQYQHKHHKKETDVFRIADDERIMVHLQLDNQGRNVLLDTFPKARTDIMSGIEPNTFDFQSKVNAQFFGITNFIMGNADHVEVIGPELLKAHLQRQAKKIEEKYAN